ncbi:MAG: SDR family NAD(P)-dependent oxidoreductase, partial [Candidatus Eremiobacteraeota bacterium]|nr:SDR family NAD(P)-dependent oxidoreductase [Candidatus Eremiobacteraeota bacterium]
MSERRTALVVGAASGMGAATARVLGRDGYALALADRDAAGVQRVAQEIEGEHGGPVAHFALDITDEAAIQRVFDAAVAALGGRLDAMAVPAGITDSTPFFDLTVARWREISEINVLGTFLCVREAARRM